MKKIAFIGLAILLFCSFPFQNNAETIVPGAERLDSYLPLLKGKKVAVLANQSSMVTDTHLVDTLLSLGINIAYIFAPEHGFRGDADAGETIGNYTDEKTGLPVISLYGNIKSPPDSILQKIDVTVFDLQDVGLRFYTYMSSLHYLMEASANNNKEVIILDRPNPNGFYVDGPVLDMKYRSFVGIYPVPVVHGMTLGEIARMANGEGWLTDGKQCALTVITCADYTHRSLYLLPVKPSPNLPNMTSIYLYPSLCFFEATPVSIGRGTDFPFQVYGHPDMKRDTFTFTPESNSGAKNPPLKGQKCYGVDLRELPEQELLDKGVSFEYIIDAYNALGKPAKFFNSLFEKLVGVDYIRPMLIEGKSAEQIKASWQKDVEKFKQQREKYLLYD